MMRRPSNSGIAIWVAASSGVSPSALAAHWARQEVRHRPCRIGTSRAASAPMSHSSSEPPAPAAAGTRPPAASTVTTMRVRRAQRVDQRGLGGPQRRAEHRERPPARRRHRVGERVHEAGVPRDVMGAVVQDRDDRAGLRGVHGVRGGRPARSSTPQAGIGHRRVESLAGQRDRVRQEPGQLPQVLRAAVRQVRVRLGDDPRRYRRQLHQLGVRCLLAAEHDGGHPGGQDRVEPVFPGPAPAEDADHDDVGAVEERGHLPAESRAGLPSR